MYDKCLSFCFCGKKKNGGSKSEHLVTVKTNNRNEKEGYKDEGTELPNRVKHKQKQRAKHDKSTSIDHPKLLLIRLF